MDVYEGWGRWDAYLSAMWVKWEMWETPVRWVLPFQGTEVVPSSQCVEVELRMALLHLVLHCYHTQDSRSQMVGVYLKSSA